MNILAIMGSPHKGNCSEIVEGIETKLRAMGDVEFRYAHLRSMDLKPCAGCYACFARGEEHCPLKDDRDALIEQIEWADGVIWVSPVYAMHVTSLMKRLVDRLSYMLHRPRYFHKYALVVAVAGNVGLKPTLDYLKNIVSGIGFQVVGRLGYRAAPKGTAVRTLPSGKDPTDEVLRRFHDAIAQREPQKLGLMDHIGFRVMRAVYGRMETMLPYDYAYWRERGWLDRGARYYVDQVRPNRLADLLARVAAFVMGRQMDKALVGDD